MHVVLRESYRAWWWYPKDTRTSQQLRSTHTQPCWHRLRLSVVGTTTRSQTHNTKKPSSHHDVETFLCPLGLGRLCFFRSIGLCVTWWCPKGGRQGCCQDQDCQAQKVRVFRCSLEKHLRGAFLLCGPSTWISLLLELLSTLACQLDQRLVSIHGNMLRL